MFGRNWLELAGADFTERDLARSALFFRRLQIESSEGERGLYKKTANEIFALISTKSISAQIYEATPFFWRSALSCLSNPSCEASWRDLCLNLLDSYSIILPDDHPLRFEANESFMPKTLAKDTRISLNPYLMSANGSSDLFLIGGFHSHLFDDDLKSSVVSELNSESVDFIHMLEEAIELIQIVDEELGRRLRTRISWYVQLRRADTDTHYSLTCPRLPRVIFLSQAKDKIRLAEALVHEFGHNNLNALHDVYPLFDDSSSCEFYSPWRPDKRPLSGLFHAVFVFGEILDFLMKLGHARLAPQASLYLDRRVNKIRHQLRIAISEIPRSRLTDLGNEILSAEIKSLDAVDRAIASQLPPPEVISHLETFRGGD